MTQTQSRRSFLVLFGCGLVGLATDWSGALKHLASAPSSALPGRAFAFDLYLFSKGEAGLYVLGRGASDLLVCPIGPRSFFRWYAPPGNEVVALEASIETLNVFAKHGPDVDWSMMWELRDCCASVTGCEYCGRPYFAWPAGGHCLSCGGALPAPMIGGSGTFVTRVIDGVRETLPLDRLEQSPDRSCDYCGSQLEDGLTNCASCGAGAPA